MEILEINLYALEKYTIQIHKKKKVNYNSKKSITCVHIKKHFRFYSSEIEILKMSSVQKIWSNYIHR